MPSSIVYAIVGSVYLLTDVDIPTIGSIIQVDLRLKEHKYRQFLSSNVAGCCTTRTDFVVPSSRDGQLCSLSIVSTTVVKELAPGPRKRVMAFLNSHHKKQILLPTRITH